MQPLTPRESIARTLADVPDVLNDWATMSPDERAAWLMDWHNEMAKLEHILQPQEDAATRRHQGWCVTVNSPLARPEDCNCRPPATEEAGRDEGQ